MQQLNANSLTAQQWSHPTSRNAPQPWSLLRRTPHHQTATAPRWHTPHGPQPRRAAAGRILGASPVL